MEPTWAIVEIMGHQRIAGMVSEEEIAGTLMLRVDVPEVEDKPGFTRFFGNSAIYAITPTDERTAKHAVKHFNVRPLERWVLPDVPTLSTGDDEPFEFESVEDYEQALYSEEDAIFGRDDE